MMGSYLTKRESKKYALKRSELIKVCNNIVNQSKNSPYYKIDFSKENKKYTIGVKETALAINEKLREISDSSDNFFRNQAVSISDDQIVSANLLCEDTNELPEKIMLSVNSLASGQVNCGKELFQPSRGLPLGRYEFSEKVLGKTHDLLFHQKERTDNLTTLKNMANYLNQYGSEITASVEAGERSDYSYLRISSNFMGKYEEETFSFEEDDENSNGVVSFFGLDRVDKFSSNAEFELNGTHKQTRSNSFTLEKTLQIDLHQLSEEPVTLRIVPDSDQILSHVQSFMDTYNKLIYIAKTRMEETREHFRASKLVNELKSIEKTYKDELDACGLKAGEEGLLSMDELLASQASEDGGMERLFKRENGFASKMFDKMNAVAINPMDYLDKIVVTYPGNDRTSFINPYVTSIYSGLFFNSFC